VCFVGGFAWVHLYGQDLDRPHPHSLFNVGELDKPDEITMKDFYDEFATSDWRMIIAHIIGVDHAGHYYSNLGHYDLERKLKDMEKILQDIVDKLDNDTVLIAFGDHGMTN
jgi:phosphatidylinositol glycan class O